MQTRVRYFTAAFNAGLEMAISIADQLNSKLKEVLPDEFGNRFEPNTLSDLIDILPEMKLDDPELVGLHEAFAEASVKMDIGNQFDLPMIPVDEALRIYVEELPRQVQKMVTRQPDGWIWISAMGEKTLHSRAPISETDCAVYAPFFMGTETINDSCPF